jgi:multiple sugar transport system permease protein
MSKKLVHALRWLVFAVAVLVMNFPVISTLVTSLKSDGEISSNASLWINQPTLANYAAIFGMADRFDILHFLGNSLVASALGSALAIVLTFPAAYAMVRFGTARSWLMPLVVNLRAIPLIIFAIPIYLMYQQVSLLDTRTGLALILCLVNIPLALVLFSSAIAELPTEIEDAARVDGATTVKLLLHVVAPMSLNVMAAATVLAFIYSWNEFLDADHDLGDPGQRRRLVLFRGVGRRCPLGRRRRRHDPRHVAAAVSRPLHVPPDRRVHDCWRDQGVKGQVPQLIDSFRNSLH